MKSVKPIKDKELIIDILNFYKNLGNTRNYMMVFLGFNLGLRISDLLKLKCFEVRNKDFLYLIEKKTKKQRFVPIFPHVKKEIENYLYHIPNNLYLFQSKTAIKPITRIRAYQILSKIKGKFHLEDIGTHTLRKTFGYHYYHDNNCDLVSLQKIFGHFDPSVTIRYIDMEDKYVRDKLVKWGGFRSPK